MKIIGKLACFFARKHKRGRRVIGMPRDSGYILQCPRCGATWARKAKVRP